MNIYSQHSKEQLNSCDRRLQEVFLAVLQLIDHTVLEGHRGEQEQNRDFEAGKSKLRWPNGKHNKIPSLAVDAMPYPVDWKDQKRLYYFAGLVVGVGSMMGIKIRWGGDFNQNNDFNDDSFVDGPHFELTE